MNTTRFHSRRGVALVIVLAVLMLMSGLLVAFMGRVSTERAASRAIAQSFEAKQAYDSAVNLVMSQIREGTASQSGKRGWASQPGVIRTFAVDSKDKELTVYKLYSSAMMQESGDSYNPAAPSEAGLDGDMAKTPMGFVDLNDPILVPVPGSTTGAVEAHFPIVNPYARQTVNGTEPAPGRGIVEGFVAANVVHQSNLKDKAGKSILALPMRAKWLYQLKDGSLVAPDAAGVIAGATQQNPPVARVAFWTDDESGKININTASEGTFWDTPHASNRHESGNVSSSGYLQYDPANSNSFAASQPANREYQRYPGHPATTSLSPVLRWLAPTLSEVDFKEAIYRLSPRYVGGYGTSMGASRNVEYDTNLYVGKRDRLFQSLDEYWFRPDRTPITNPSLYKVFRTTTTAGVTDTRLTDGTKFTPETLDRLRFFLTANSRAPEVNLWGKPRVAIWPVFEDDDLDPKKSRRSGYDDLISFVSTIGKKPYGFSRRNSTSPTYDFENSGADTRFQNDNGSTTVLDNPGRNKALFEYLAGLLESPVPGVGAKFSTKYNAKPAHAINDSRAFEYKQILLSIFDYIRTINLVDTGRRDVSIPGYPLAYTPNYSPNNPPVYNGTSRPNMGSGQVVPTTLYAPGDAAQRFPVMKGFGRFNTVSEVALVFYIDELAENLPKDTAPQAPVINSPNGWTNYYGMRVALVPEFFNVAAGYPAMSQAFAYRVSETDENGNPAPLRVSLPGTNPLLPVTPIELATGTNGVYDINVVDVDANRTGDGRFFMPTQGITSNFVYEASAPGTGGNPKVKRFSKPNPGGDYTSFPFYSKRIYLPGTPSTAGNTTTYTLPSEFVFEGGNLTLEIMSLNGVATAANPTPPPGAVVQRITVNFPKVTLKVPKRGTHVIFHKRLGAALAGMSKPSIDPYDPNNPTKLLPNAGGNNADGSPDTIRSVVPAGRRKPAPDGKGIAYGDYRMIAGRAVVGSNYWDVSGELAGTTSTYFNTSIRAVHSLTNSWGRRFDTRSPVGQISNFYNFRTGNNKVADIPSMYAAASLQGPAAMSVDGSATGDFDRGMSKHVDGPGINHPDEGNVRFSLSDSPDTGGHLPYFRGADGYEEVGQTYFSPNRLIPSAVYFGSLPTGLFSGRAWETLLFAPPVPNAHRGADDPADHYMLDLFYMPIVEPYAISEPMSTAGKISLNCKIAPYGYVQVAGRGYIERTTGIHALLKGMKQMAVRNGATDGGHEEHPLKSNEGPMRFNVDVYRTVELVLNARLNQGKGYFKSATQFCELDILTSNFVTPTVAGRKAFWENNNATGDNQREKIYAHVYPRLTTKSNVYTVHVWAQSIVKNPNSTEWNKFNENTDRVTGEYRGSTTIERYIDPNDTDLRDYDAAASSSTDLDRFYRFRILNSKRFTQ